MAVQANEDTGSFQNSCAGLQRFDWFDSPKSDGNNRLSSTSTTVRVKEVEMVAVLRVVFLDVLSDIVLRFSTSLYSSFSWVNGGSFRTDFVQNFASALKMSCFDSSWNQWEVVEAENFNYFSHSRWKRTVAIIFRAVAARTHARVLRGVFNGLKTL